MARLTPRERQIAEMLTYGYTNPQICEDLGIGERTVKRHIQSLMDKMGAENRTMVAVAYQGEKLSGLSRKDKGNLVDVLGRFEQFMKHAEEFRAQVVKILQQ